MQLTIDSNEALDRVIEVVGSFYGVRLAVAADAGATSAPAAVETAKSKPAGRRAARTKAAPSRVSARRGKSAKPAATAVESAAVRIWARANGHQVSDRGPVPAGVLAAYNESA